ncbi:hypothetical protein [Phreatobacter stygius]|uniref:Uncharacterized protein n=1 Tax=Phreatobacter stygius TaxID=1940610 RepID=A0A4D7ATU5_9HYPH|nr:hypothetical protein [Phreatobacter stygius]QCI63035.1 hypothetical protein E8M01_01525 [Phreatobacter stygius]
MTLIWLGALLFVGGVLYLAYEVLWQGPLSALRRSRAAGAGDTLEPRRGGSYGTTWPGFALLAAGAALLLGAAVGAS